MRNVTFLLAAVLCACGVTSGTTEASGRPEATPASVAALTPFYGSYSTQDGDLIVIARLGWYFDLRTSAYRTIYATPDAKTFSIGFAFQVPSPRFAALVFSGDVLTVRAAGATTTARRLHLKSSDIHIDSGGVALAATITEAEGAGPHPGVVIVHGAEPGQRYFYDIWVGIYTHLGFDVLTYDKRGVGGSSGVYPGEYPSPQALAVYAEDAGAALDVLSRWPGVDRRRVGFHGGSQGGWTVALAMSARSGAAFAVLASAAATTVDQTDLWASFTNGGAEPAGEPVDQMLAQVRAAGGGYDPRPALAGIGIPVLWLLGANDRTVPTTVCVEILDSMAKPNFTITLLPAGHALLANTSGLLGDDARSRGLAPQLVPALSTWIATQLDPG